MMRTYKTVLSIKPDVVTANGRVYPRAVLKAAFDEKMKGNLFITSGISTNGTIDPSKILGSVEDVKFLAEDIELSGKIFPHIVPEEVDFQLSPDGLGKLDPDTNEISDYKLISMSVSVRQQQS
jgi:hypothetical protein